MADWKAGRRVGEKAEHWAAQTAGEKVGRSADWTDSHWAEHSAEQKVVTTEQTMVADLAAPSVVHLEG